MYIGLNGDAVTGRRAVCSGGSCETKAVKLGSFSDLEMAESLSGEEE